MDFTPAPKPITKKPNRTKSKGKIKGVSLVKGVKVPHRKQRAKIKREQYNEALREWGETCFCGTSQIEMHHVKFRAQGGRGNFRNLHPLCKKHHILAHTDRVFADWLRQQHEQRYGEWYWSDKYDIWKAGYIENPTDELFNKFMKRESMKIGEKTK